LPETASSRERRKEQALTREDLELFEALTRRHEAQIYRVAYRLTGSHDEAQDLIQDALLEALRDFARFERGTHFDRWLFRIMSNTQIDKVRRRPKVAIISIDDAWNGEWGGPSERWYGERRLRDVPDDSAGPEEQLLRHELEAPLQRALAALPPEFRSAVILADLEGMTYEEISHALGCPIGTVRSRLNRGRNLMRKLLGPHLRQIFETGEHPVREEGS
jgi:RNA polymerase sigma-70 factor, ECF subfamily